MRGKATNKPVEALNEVFTPPADGRRRRWVVLPWDKLDIYGLDGYVPEFTKLDGEQELAPRSFEPPPETTKGA